MSTATQIDPATDAKLADLEKKLGQAHALRGHLVTAIDALDAASAGLSDNDLSIAHDDEVATARMHANRAYSQINKTIELLKAKEVEVRGW